MSKEKLEQEVREAADAMKRAATKIGEQDTANAALKTDLDNAKSQLADAQAKLAAGGVISEDDLNSMSSTLDSASNALDAVVTATTGAAEAVTDASAAAENVDTSSATDARQG